MKPVKDSDILRAARKRIESCKNTMLCPALDKVRKGSVEQKTRLKRWIAHMLEGHATYGTWIYTRHPEVHKRMTTIPGAMLQGRLAWIDWMIEQCEKAEAT